MDNFLLEGVPGLAKTLAINTLADVIDAKSSQRSAIYSRFITCRTLIGTMNFIVRKKKNSCLKKVPILQICFSRRKINRAQLKSSQLC